MKIYFKGGKGIKNPVDFNGIEIKVDDILTSDCFDPFFSEEFYKKNYPAWTKEDIENRKNRATYKVKRNEKGFFYAEGINAELYLHDFRFEYTKVVLQITLCCLTSVADNVNELMETNINITSGLSAEKQTAIVPNNGYSGYGSLNKNEIMKIQDFRIGNYILDGGEFATVELINGEMEEVYFKGQKIYLSENIQYIVPIPINEKWLLDFGFEKTLDNEFTLRYDLKNDARFYYYLPRHNLKTFGLRFKGSTFFDEVKYVHQLQNFYFALTGNELVYENKKK